MEFIGQDGLNLIKKGWRALFAEIYDSEFQKRAIAAVQARPGRRLLRRKAIARNSSLLRWRRRRRNSTKRRCRARIRTSLRRRSLRTLLTSGPPLRPLRHCKLLGKRRRLRPRVSSSYPSGNASRGRRRGRRRQTPLRYRRSPMQALLQNETFSSMRWALAVFFFFFFFLG